MPSRTGRLTTSVSTPHPESVPGTPRPLGSPFWVVSALRLVRVVILFPSLAVAPGSRTRVLDEWCPLPSQRHLVGWPFLSGALHPPKTVVLLPTLFPRLAGALLSRMTGLLRLPASFYGLSRYPLGLHGQVHLCCHRRCYQLFDLFQQILVSGLFPLLPRFTVG